MAFEIINLLTYLLDITDLRSVPCLVTDVHHSQLIASCQKLGYRSQNHNISKNIHLALARVLRVRLNVSQPKHQLYDKCSIACATANSTPIKISETLALCICHVAALCYSYTRRYCTWQWHTSLRAHCRGHVSSELGVAIGCKWRRSSIYRKVAAAMHPRMRMHVLGCHCHGHFLPRSLPLSWRRQWQRHCLPIRSHVLPHYGCNAAIIAARNASYCGSSFTSSHTDNDVRSGLLFLVRWRNPTTMNSTPAHAAQTSAAAGDIIWCRHVVIFRCGRFAHFSAVSAAYWISSSNHRSFISCITYYTQWTIKNVTFYFSL